MKPRVAIRQPCPRCGCRLRRAHTRQRAKGCIACDRAWKREQYDADPIYRIKAAMASVHSKRNRRIHESRTTREV